MINPETKQVLRAEYLNVLATVGCFVAGLGVTVTMFLSIHNDIGEALVRLERHDVHIEYLMTGRVPVQAELRRE